VGGEGEGRVGGKGGGGGRGEKWTKPCIHTWIIKEKWKKKDLCIYNQKGNNKKICEFNYIIISQQHIYEFNKRGKIMFQLIKVINIWKNPERNSNIMYSCI
jgi:hypothetical protein